MPKPYNNLNNTNIITDEQIDNDVKMITVTLAYAPTATQHLYKSLQVKQGTTLYHALKKIGWLQDDTDLAIWCENNKDITKNSDIDKKSWRVGVYSVKKPLSYELINHDRIEVYRPLTIDPKYRRKVKAQR